MYIPDFVCGIIFTILAEVVAIVVYGIVVAKKNKKK